MYIRLGKTGSLGPWSRVMVCCSKLCFCQNDPPNALGLRQPTGQRQSNIKTQHFFLIRPILFLYYKESLVSSNWIQNYLGFIVLILSFTKMNEQIAKTPNLLIFVRTKLWNRPVFNMGLGPIFTDIWLWSTLNMYVRSLLCKNLAFYDPPSLKFHNRTDINVHGTCIFRNHLLWFCYIFFFSSAVTSTALVTLHLDVHFWDPFVGFIESTPNVGVQSLNSKVKEVIDFLSL